MKFSHIPALLATALRFHTFTIAFAASHCKVQSSAPGITVNQTAKSNSLQTWWHNVGEINSQTAVKNENVRQSHLYLVQVSSFETELSNSSYYHSFVYETIPGNGMTKDNIDGNRIGESQAWTSFLYRSDVRIKIQRKGKSAGPVTIRPTNLNITATVSDLDTYITVPYTSSGYKFSVEFQDDLRTLSPTTSEEPWNILLIFASAFSDANDVPTEDENSLVVPPGRVTGLQFTRKSTIIFEPGVYYLTGQAHLNLSSTVEWVYLAPGAYVKGAVEFNSLSSKVKVTGQGVLSGEQYVWSANPNSGYQNTNAPNVGLRMWSGHNADLKQIFYLKGPTVNAPPFNSMDWNGNTNLVSTIVSDYKQVGSYYGQTDGLQNYPGSVIKNVFYHTNDDTIKMYYSNVLIDNVVIWKLGVAPVVQFGWASRNISNITVNAVSVIHQSYSASASNPGLIGSNNDYTMAPFGISSNHNTAHTTNLMQNVVWSNFRAEGPSACLFRIYSLENMKGLKIINAWIERFEQAAFETTQSLLPEFYDASSGEQVKVQDFTIENFVVGTIKITAINAIQVGQIKVASSYLQSMIYQ